MQPAMQGLTPGQCHCRLWGLTPILYFFLPTPGLSKASTDTGLRRGGTAMPPVYIPGPGPVMDPSNAKQAKHAGACSSNGERDSDPASPMTYATGK